MQRKFYVSVHSNKIFLTNANKLNKSFTSKIPFLLDNFNRYNMTAKPEVNLFMLKNIRK